MKTAAFQNIKAVAVVALTMAFGLAVGDDSAPVPAPPERGVRPPAARSGPASGSAAARKYTLVELTAIPGFDFIHANGLNNLGQVVGSADSTNNETHAVLWDNGVATDLGTFGGSKSLASGINDAGDIVGTILTNGQRRVFLRHNGQISDLGVIDGYAKLGREESKVYTYIYNAPRVAINGLAQVTGHLTVGNNQRSFIWTQGQTAYFGLLGDGSLFFAEAINNHRQILGRAMQRDLHMRSMLWQDGQVIDFGSLNGTPSGANAVNDRGTVVGWSIPTNGAAHTFIWEKGTMRRLNGGNATRSGASAINNVGQVVGSAQGPGHRSFACLWNGDEMWDLNDLVGMESGWRLVSADAINDRGQILARAMNGKQERDCLLSPLNPPLVFPGKATLASSPLKNKAVANMPFNLTAFERLPSGAFRLVFAGRSDGKYAVEASTDLMTWTLLGPATNDEGKVEFTDGDAARFTLRFYRLALVP